MIKRISVLLGLLIMTMNFSFAQKEITLQFLNQYETPLKKVSVENAGKTNEYAPDKAGFAVVNVDPSSPVTVTSHDHENVVLSANELTDKKIVQLHKIFSWKDLLNPMFYIINGGFWLLLFIVFAETGLFAGFFLPGDSLLFVAGIYSANLAHEFLKALGLGGVHSEWFDLFLLVALISVAGILGNMLGYWFGRKIGPTMYTWKDRFLFKKKYLNDAHDFYEKHGGGAIIFARFLPVIRTFAPIIAGIVQMDRRKFMLNNIIGSVAWVVSMVFAGHFLQIWVRKQFGFELKDHLEMIVIGIIVVTTAPVLWKIFFGSKKPTQTT
ncbi:DedA family protein [Pinibacter soli]|uniref:VTT domain-containing protein n=1 Tax=Pinibacter soli TaxID=3044211 RepID=A0ABT6RHX0_9BACT|nr:VTT domain-containing protein [Pinibacter soli]MDI3322164.1 VTT domain-containing protein [Pinibacter soli]